MGRIYLALAGAVLFLSCQSASAQICRPIAERTGEVGCWIIASQPVGQFVKAETFWHLDVYATRTEAEAAKASGGVVVESLGKTWLLTIAGQGWRPPAISRHSIQSGLTCHDVPRGFGPDPALTPWSFCYGRSIER